jgi:predicted nucleotidyltransferase
MDEPFDFYEWGGSLPGLRYATVDWADFDHDTFQDLLITGHYLARRSWVCRKSYLDWEIIAELHPVYHGAADVGDCDGDGDPDILLTGMIGLGSVGISIIYRNDYPDFTDVGAVLPGVSYGAVAWGDYDNDGDPDILLTGDQAGTYISKIYRNDYPDFVEDTGVVLPGIAHGSVAWGDYDNDGDLDILLTGNDGAAGISRIYRNTGGAFAEDSTVGLDDVEYGDAAWGDYDNDGDLDILLAGYRTGTFIAKIYRNDHPDFVEDTAAVLPGIAHGSVAWGDYDCDGDLDILMVGSNEGGRLSRIYRNDAPGFTDIGGSLPGVDYGEAAWGHIDNGMVLDFAIVGTDGGGDQACTYMNARPAGCNTPADAPTNLEAFLEGQTITFEWDAAVDLETPAAGLTYNLRVGSVPGGSDICTAETGFLTVRQLVPEFGNTNHNTSWRIAVPDPQPAVYYWSVQAVDSGFFAGIFAEEQTFTPMTAAPDQSLPQSFALGTSAPNPFNPWTRISYELPRAEHVRLRIYDARGCLVRTLVDSWREGPLRHEVVWDGRDDLGRRVASGSYVYRLNAGSFEQSRQVTMVK